MAKRITARQVNELGTAYTRAVQLYGEPGAGGALVRYYDARAQWERENGRPFGTARSSRSSNPNILVVGNPGEIVSRRVEYIEYVHGTEGPRWHEFSPGVRLECLPDGSVRLFHPKRRLWFDDGK